MGGVSKSKAMCGWRWMERRCAEKRWTAWGGGESRGDQCGGWKGKESKNVVNPLKFKKIDG